MELLSYALFQPLVPFVVVMALAAVGYGLSQLAARSLSGSERPAWALLILALPPLGRMLYDQMGRELIAKENPADTEVV